MKTVDKQFLQRCVEAAVQLELAMTNSLICIKTPDGRHVYCSKQFVHLMGIELNEIIGKKVPPQLYNNDKQYKQVIDAEAHSTVQSRQSKTILKIANFQGELMPLIAIKSPIVNPTINNVAGIYVRAHEPCTLNLIQKPFLPPNIATEPSMHKVDTQLSRREKQVISFLII